MRFDRYETVYIHNGVEYTYFEEAVMAALDIVDKEYRIYSCPSCHREKRAVSWETPNCSDCQPKEVKK